MPKKKRPASTPPLKVTDAASLRNPNISKIGQQVINSIRTDKNSTLRIPDYINAQVGLLPPTTSQASSRPGLVVRPKAEFYQLEEEVQTKICLKLQEYITRACQKSNVECFELVLACETFNEKLFISLKLHAHEQKLIDEDLAPSPSGAAKLARCLIWHCCEELISTLNINRQNFIRLNNNSGCLSPKELLIKLSQILNAKQTDLDRQMTLMHSQLANLLGFRSHIETSSDIHNILALKASQLRDSILSDAILTSFKKWSALRNIAMRLEMSLKKHKKLAAEYHLFQILAQNYRTKLNNLLQMIIRFASDQKIQFTDILAILWLSPISIFNDHFKLIDEFVSTCSSAVEKQTVFSQQVLSCFSDTLAASEKALLEISAQKVEIKKLHRTAVNQTHENLTDPSTTYSPTLWASSSSEQKEIKAEAADKLKIERKKLEKRQARASAAAQNAGGSSAAADSPLESPWDHFFYQLSHEDLQEIPAIQIPNTRYLYLAYNITNTTISPTILETYKPLIQEARTLSRTSSRQSGIKIFGEWIALKKVKKGDRLICIIREIPDSPLKVYLPAAVLSHKEYEKLIDNPAILTQHTKLLPQEETLFDNKDTAQTQLLRANISSKNRM